MPPQSEMGKAFEYAVLKSIYNELSERQPIRIVDNGSFKEESTNTIIVTCNHGWSISMRIHSASSRVEASLKFDVKLEGMPPELYTAFEVWGRL